MASRFLYDLEAVALTLALIAVSAGLLYGINEYLDRPTVYRSWSTKECRAVVFADGRAGSCDLLPAKYEQVWVD